VLEHDLPILTELRDDLDAAFARAEAKVPARRRRWVVSAGGLALAGAAAAVIALTSGTVTPPPASAAEALRRVAAVAAQAPAPVPRDDQFYYVKTRATWLSMFAGEDPQHEHAATLVEHDREIWLSVDRPGQLRDKVVGSRPLTGADTGRKQSADGAPQAPNGRMEPLHHYLLGSERLTRAQLLAFPTDPRTIYDRLRARTGGRGNSPAGEVFTEIGDALRESPAPAALRAGLYGALALVPGIELVGTVKDSAGRPGTAVAFTENGTRRELIFDPATSELLAEQDVLLDPERAELDAPVGTVVGDAVYLRRAVTDKLETPAR
jgi:hypothetical protein